jgi:hypothetical protein
MGLLELLGLRGRGGNRHLVVITFEGPGRLRLNANRTSSKRSLQGAVAHEGTVGWIEFAADGSRLDQGVGPAAGKLGPAAVAALLRDLPTNPACQSVLRGLVSGRDHSSKVLDFAKWGQFGVGSDSSGDVNKSEG